MLSNVQNSEAHHRWCEIITPLAPVLQLSNVCLLIYFCLRLKFSIFRPHHQTIKHTMPNLPKLWGVGSVFNKIYQCKIIIDLKKIISSKFQWNLWTVTVHAVKWDLLLETCFVGSCLRSVFNCFDKCVCDDIHIFSHLSLLHADRRWSIKPNYKSNKSH